MLVVAWNSLVSGYLLISRQRLGAQWRPREALRLHAAFFEVCTILDVAEFTPATASPSASASATSSASAPASATPRHCCARTKYCCQFERKSECDEF